MLGEEKMLEIKNLKNKNERALIQGERMLGYQEPSRIIGGQVGPETHIGCQNDQVNPDGQGTTYVGYAPDDIYQSTTFLIIFTKQDLVDNPQDPDNPTPCNP